MTNEERIANFGAGVRMVKQLDGLVPLLMFGYNPENGQWRILAHVGLVPVIQDDEQRETLKRNIGALLDEGKHPENIQILGRDEQAHPFSDPETLERMMGTEEGGEG